MLLLSGALAVLERRVSLLFSACRCSPSHYLPQERAAALGGSEEAETWAFLATHFAADGRRYLLERLGFSGTPLDGLVRTLLLVQICCVLLRSWSPVKLLERLGFSGMPLDGSAWNRFWYGARWLCCGDANERLPMNSCSSLCSSDCSAAVASMFGLLADVLPAEPEPEAAEAAPAAEGGLEGAAAEAAAADAAAQQVQQLTLEQQAAAAAAAGQLLADDGADFFDKQSPTGELGFRRYAVVVSMSLFLGWAVHLCWLPDGGTLVAKQSPTRYAVEARRRRRLRATCPRLPMC